MIKKFKAKFFNILQKVAGNNILINNTTVRPTKRTSQDITNWRNAMQQAEGYSQQRRNLYDLYTDILLDGYLSAVVKRRIDQITNTDLAFVAPDGKVIDEITHLVNTSYFETLLVEVMNSKFWGHSLIELLWPALGSNEKGKSLLIPRKNVKPRWGVVTQEEFDTEGVEYRKPPFEHKIIEVGEAEDLGVFLGVAQYVIYKRGDFGNWAEFADIFGIPFRHATYNNEQARLALEKGLEEAGPAGYLITQEGTDLKILSGNPSGNGHDVFRFLREACNEEIGLTILGNTMTSMESRSSGYAQSNTHADAENKLVLSDRKFVLRVLNEQLTPYLAKMGYPIKGGKWQFRDEEKLSLKDRISIDLQVAGQVPISDDYWYEKYGIPKPDKSEVDDDKGKKKTKSELKLNAYYNFHYSSCGCTDCLTLSDLPPIKFTPISSKVESALTEAIRKGKYDLNETLHRQYYQRLRKFARSGFGRSLGKASNLADFELQQGILRNISQFAATKQRSLIEELRQHAINNPADYKANAKATLLRYHKRYFEAELTTIEASANSASQWEDFIENSDLFPNLMYSTVGDARVRPEHAKLDGAIYPVNDEFWNNHTPPLDWRCRCVLIQTDDEPNKLPPIQPRKGLGNNPFKTKRLIAKDHPYFEMGENEFNDLMDLADTFRSNIERTNIAEQARKELRKKMSLQGLDVKLSKTDLNKILKSESPESSIRNAMLSILAIIVEELATAGTQAGTGYHVFQLSILDTSFQFLFEKGDEFILKEIYAL